MIVMPPISARRSSMAACCRASSRSRLPERVVDAHPVFGGLCPERVDGLGIPGLDAADRRHRDPVAPVEARDLQSRQRGLDRFHASGDRPEVIGRRGLVGDGSVESRASDRIPGQHVVTERVFRMINLGRHRVRQGVESRDARRHRRELARLVAAHGVHDPADHERTCRQRPDEGQDAIVLREDAVHASNLRRGVPGGPPLIVRRVRHWFASTTASSGS
jgi:hypothetical protein